MNINILIYALYSTLIGIALNSCENKRSNTNQDVNQGVHIDTFQNNIEDTFIVHQRLLDSLDRYIIIERGHYDDTRGLDFYIMLDKQGSSILVNYGVSNLIPMSVDTRKGEFVGYFIFRKTRVFIFDRVPILADTLYNKEKLKIYVKPDSLGEPPGSGYIGKSFEFIW